MRFHISSDQEIQTVIQASLHRDPLDVANDAEALALLFAKRAKEKAAEAMAWLAVRRASSRE